MARGTHKLAKKPHRQDSTLLWWPLGLLVACCAAQRKTHATLDVLSHSAPSHKCVLSGQSRGQPCGDGETKWRGLCLKNIQAPRGEKSLREAGYCKGHPRLSLVTCVTPAPGIDGLSEARSILVDVIRTAREEVGKVICISVFSQQGRDVSAFRCIPHILHIVSAQQILPAWMNNWSAC